MTYAMVPLVSAVERQNGITLVPVLLKIFAAAGTGEEIHGTHQACAYGESNGYTRPCPVTSHEGHDQQLTVIQVKVDSL